VLFNEVNSTLLNKTGTRTIIVGPPVGEISADYITVNHAPIGPGASVSIKLNLRKIVARNALTYEPNVYSGQPQ
jgi:hypothetical protein